MNPAHAGLYKEIGGRIREQRRLAGMSQVELAGRLSISRPSLGNIEVGRQSVLVGQLYDIARQLGCAPGDLAPKPHLASRDVIYLRRRSA